MDGRRACRGAATVRPQDYLLLGTELTGTAAEGCGPSRVPVVRSVLAFTSAEVLNVPHFGWPV